ncbi:uncharacterized protein LOC133837317 isoform X1 [Drosophila sulfurigaster albostrigata]|uniref:uncharacterized protein LOC133837317 isoform X1 n=1 Tax=Drosophila sulfurigaster albostrigata TaxID=89887 RepID=UPI002D21D05F|nr:uncharacterized protein LOC133837317 isoform X1 [Drosophila sulfurigaster albostrigata]
MNLTTPQRNNNRRNQGMVRNRANEQAKTETVKNNGKAMKQSYLNSCIKVPIDPCNNCPAPVYNRPRLCMGKQAKAKASSPKSLDAAATATWTSQTGIRSLAKFYDSIPDYCEVKHLHKAEFYSTLESLRTTSRELRSAPADPSKERCASATPSYGSGKTKQRNTKGKKLKKKTHPPLPLPLPLSSPPSPPPPPFCLPDACHSSNNCLSEEYDKCLRDLSRLKSFKHDFAIEVADFKRSLKSFELEFKRNAERPKSTSSNGTQTQVVKEPTTPKMPAMHTAERAKCRREMLRRCFSVNDLSLTTTTTPTPRATPAPAKSTPRHQPLSNYFPVKNVPKLQIESPSTSSKRSESGSSRVRMRRRRARKPKAATETETTTEKPMPLLSIYELEQLPKRTPSVSPQHPVARPNLAATLRAEVARKKVKELQNNCTYHDPRPQYDWEVRKTPAWKSLSLNESHKALLSIRLATRKAEQALQERQYELHMQMMQQRVKSAPLLLEGATYWGPEVGKLTHSCRSEGLRHGCESNMKKQRKKKCSHRCSTAAMDAEAKLQQIRKIYGSQQHKPAATTSMSRQSQRTEPPHDSGDDLCSVDRAFL